MEHAHCVLVVLEDGESLQFWQEQLAVFGAKTTVLRSLDHVAQVCHGAQADLLLFPVDVGYVPLMVAKLRNDFAHLGIVALHRDLNPSLRVQLLLTGADACMPVDIDVPELMAWCHAVRRRFLHADGTPIAQQSDEQGLSEQDEWILRDKGWTLVSPDDVSLELTHSERQLMDAFVRHADARFSREDLMRDKGIAAGDSRAVDSLISRLRRKAAQAGVTVPIKSVHGWGYTFTGRLVAQLEPHEHDVMDFQPFREEPVLEQAMSAELLRAVQSLDVQDPRTVQSLSFNYQLRVAAGSGQYSGVDAQVFWTAPGGQRLGADRVLQHMSDPDRRRALCQWMTQTLMSDVRRWWQEYSLRASHIGIKLPVEMLEYYYKHLPEQLRRLELDPASIELDVFSDNLLDDFPNLVQRLEYLRVNGVQVWLSSVDIENHHLSRLREWPIRGIKLEAQVIKRACAEPTFRALLETACHLINELGLEVVVKGVDTLEQRDLALNLELNHYQGQLTSELMSEDGFLLTLASSEPVFSQNYDTQRRLSEARR
ncbi:MAG TPA: EAL domain-containing protein [Alcaligenes sp.]|nr:EAL domain-containing protein [Alcaligenes sp.]HRL26159.1 EAL domain-containing protein [Alcaligenes sp.]